VSFLVTSVPPKVQFKHAVPNASSSYIHMNPKSGSGGNGNNLHRHQTVTYLGFLQTKESSIAVRGSLPSCRHERSQAPARCTYITRNQYDSIRLIIGPRWSRCTCCWSLAPRSFAEHFLTFSGSFDNAALLALCSLQRTTGGHDQHSLPVRLSSIIAWAFV